MSSIEQLTFPTGADLSRTLARQRRFNLNFSSKNASSCASTSALISAKLFEAWQLHLQASLQRLKLLLLDKL